ncbi:MAG: phosphoribosylformylglycinamidine synthase [Saprospiraceae bacterium]|nr:phosphoribosylformylglycinamidine synthase [Saprospiraceae bacterium]
MIFFFTTPSQKVFALQTNTHLSQEYISRLTWLFGNAELKENKTLTGHFVGPRAAMITPWSTNAVEITQNMGIDGIIRIEEFKEVDASFNDFDPMISQKYAGLDQEIYTINIEPEDILHIEDIQAYNKSEGLALSEDEVGYLNDLSERLGRKLTDSEVFGFSQVNSEHCRHKIFNGTFIIDGEEKPSSLFKLIKKTSAENPNGIVSAYKDNVAFVEGPTVEQFAPKKPDVPSNYQIVDFDSVISLKAETHNFPTTVEPFNGAATGSGGEIRDRLAGGKGSIPMAGTALYMTSYSRLKEDRPWEKAFPERKWLYQTPMDILIKASNGASDFGNKFGQPLIVGSLLTFEHQEGMDYLGFDKVIMQAGGIGYGKADQALKDTPKEGDKIVLLGGDNYRIGMGGAAVSSADTGEFDSGIELNAVQRSNPEMQKRAANTVRGMVENDINPIVSIHDHGAGGHLNCLSELVEETGGIIDLEKLPVGDPTLSAKELVGNESQERMGLVIGKEDIDLLKRVAERERSPMYTVGDVTDDNRFTFKSSKNGKSPMDLKLSDMFGSSPKTIMNDETLHKEFEKISYSEANLKSYVKDILRLESVACKDWLTNKVDRCVGGKVAVQQCVGPLQIPLNNCGVMAFDFASTHGIATSMGHSPVSGLINATAGARNAIAESLTNLVWAPLEQGLKSVSLSANWMWPCRNKGEDARLYEAVEAVSELAIALGINVPTGKDSLSMAQKYSDKTVLAPGTVVISTVGHCDDFTKVVEPVLQRDGGGIYYIDFSSDEFKLGGSAFAQTQNKIGREAPSIQSAEVFSNVFHAIQEAIREGMIAAGHDISSGGMITALLELCFADRNLGANIDLSAFEGDIIKILLSENSGVILQANDVRLEAFLEKADVDYIKIGVPTSEEHLNIKFESIEESFDINEMRDIWYETSYLLDQKQTSNNLAKDRFDNYKNQALQYTFPDFFDGKMPVIDPSVKKPQAAIIREKGSNSEREMANAMYRAGFEVRDIHMTDLITGRETLEDVQFLGAVGGFSNSDVLGSAKGWAGAFKYNEKAKTALDKFFARPDTLSVGICNGCQLFLELDLINPNHTKLSKMTYNDSHKHESAFTSVQIQKNKSIMLSNMEGSTLGVWISHGEGKFNLPMEESEYNVVAKYGYDAYPSNPNGSDYNVAMLVSDDGRHLVTMPHIERSFYAWNWADYPTNSADVASPWVQAFVNAKNWCLTHK